MTIGCGTLTTANGCPLSMRAINAPTGADCSGYLIVGIVAAGLPPTPELALLPIPISPKPMISYRSPFLTRKPVDVHACVAGTMIVPLAGALFAFGLAAGGGAAAAAALCVG